MKRPHVHGVGPQRIASTRQSPAYTRGAAPRVSITVNRVEGDASRFREKQRARRRAWAIAIGIVVSLALIVTGVVLSPILTLTTLEVKGRTTIPERVVARAVDDQMGRPLALIDYDAIRDRLSSEPRIQSFSTELRPPHTLVIRVVERTAIGFLANGERWDVVDAAGVVLGNQGIKPSTIPEFQVTSTTDISFLTVIEALAAMPSGFRKRIALAEAETRDSISFVMRGVPHRIVWGSSDDSALKAVVALRAIRLAERGGGVFEIDVSAPDNIVLRPL